MHLPLQGNTSTTIQRSRGAVASGEEAGPHGARNRIIDGRYINLKTRQRSAVQLSRTHNSLGFDPKKAGRFSRNTLKFFGIGRKPAWIGSLNEKISTGLTPLFQFLSFVLLVSTEMWVVNCLGSLTVRSTHVPPFLHELDGLALNTTLFSPHLPPSSTHPRHLRGSTLHPISPPPKKIHPLPPLTPPLWTASV